MSFLLISQGHTHTMTAFYMALRERKHMVKAAHGDHHFTEYHDHCNIKQPECYTGCFSRLRTQRSTFNITVSMQRIIVEFPHLMDYLC